MNQRAQGHNGAHENGSTSRTDETTKCVRPVMPAKQFWYLISGPKESKSNLKCPNTLGSLQGE